MCSYRIRIIEISQRETGFQKSSKPNYRFSKCGLNALSSQTGASSMWMFEKHSIIDISFIVHTLQL